MGFLDKVSTMLGSASDWASNIIKPMKHNVVKGLSKAGNWLDKNHETIGAIATGIGTILQNLPSSKMKDKLQTYGQTLSNVGENVRMNRPSNLARQSISVMTGSHDNRPMPQTPATQPVLQPITQPQRAMQMPAINQGQVGGPKLASFNRTRII